MMRVPKIAIVGPESTGKSTLAEDLVQHFACGHVKEYAREYIDILDRPYVQSDLLEIAYGQKRRELHAQEKASKLLICDTNLLVIKVWSEVKYGACDPAILALMDLTEFAYYFLCDIDIPWEYDPQREHPQRRQELFDIYHQELLDASLPFCILRGNRTERLNFAIAQINREILANEG